jgi:response regulator RpfG family c-di-GMP phosphodiesterase
MVTAMHDISIALEAIRAGAYDYILKPFEKDQLHLSVRRALEHRQLVLENRTYQSDLEQLVAERTQQLSIALQDLEQSYDYTLEALGGALDAKDAETEGHCQRVTAFTITMARIMGVDKGPAAAHRARRVPARHRQNGRSPTTFFDQARSADKRKSGKRHAHATAILVTPCWNEFPS